jgi:hypothetical protein
MMPSRQSSVFALKVVVASCVAYLVAGALAYQLLTKRFYVGDAAIFAAFLRSEADPAQWRHVLVWQFPILLARSALIALSLVPFRAALLAFTPRRRVAVLFVLFFVLLHFAAAAPSPSNLEGIVYMRPELIGVAPFLLTQPEMILQSLLLAIGTGLWAARGATAPSLTAKPTSGGGLGTEGARPAD